MEHGLEYIKFYVKKHVVPLAVCSGIPLVRDGPLGETAFVRLAYWLYQQNFKVIRKFADRRRHVG